MKTEKLNVIDGKLNDKNWIDLSDHRQELSIGKKVSFPINLKIRKRSNSPYFYAVWMPEEEDDYRVTNTKRRPFEVSTKTTDARQASLYAISWVKEKQRELAEKCIEISTVKTKCLEYYWDEFFTTKQASYETRKSKTKLIRDEKLKWHSPKYGIGKEDFARISADKITRNHIVKYFASLSNGMKAQQKTVLKALFQIAENDFVGHTFPSFPPITKPQEKQVTHFEKDEWQLVMETINELSFGAAKSDLSYEAYMELETKKANRQHQRNWVDLYDAMYVNYFWFLRSQDTQRLRIEWFKEDKKSKDFICRNEEPKSDRRIENTISLNKGSYEFFKRLLKRRQPKQGYLICPNTLRESEGGQENKVRDDLNFLLKKAVQKCLPDFDMRECDFTTIRHTTFRHHLEDDPSLGDATNIQAFANNGLTSPDMLRKTYIKYISRETDLRKSSKKIKTQFALIKKVEL